MKRYLPIAVAAVLLLAAKPSAVPTIDERVAALESQVAKLNAAVFPTPTATPLVTPAPTPTPAITPAPTPAPVGAIWGSAVETDARDNRIVGGGRNDVVALRFPTNGSAIQYVAVNRRFGPDGGGYSAGTGGTLKVTIEAEVNGAPSGVALGSATVVPGNTHSHDAQFTRFAISATPASGRAFVVFTNVDPSPSTNYISLNQLTVLETHAAPRQPLGDDVAVFVKNATHGWREYTNDTGDGVPAPAAYKNTPTLDVTFADGHHAGIGYEGVRNANAYYGIADGTNTFRQKLLPTSDHVFTEAAFRVKRVAGSGDFTITLLEGTTVLASGSVASSFAPLSPDARQGSSEAQLAGGRWAVITFPAVTLKAGHTYYLRGSTTSGTTYLAVALHRVDSSDTGGSTWGSWAFREGRAQINTSDMFQVTDFQFLLR